MVDAGAEVIEADIVAGKGGKLIHITKYDQTFPTNHSVWAFDKLRSENKSQFAKLISNSSTSISAK